MRTKRFGMARLLAFLLCCLLQNASAFYNSQTGLWLSRDPITAEPLRAQLLGQAGAEGAFTFVGNQPITAFDWLGLFSTFENCSCCQIDALRNHAATAQQQIITLRSAISGAIAQVQANPSSYPWHTQYKLRRAMTTLNKSAMKLILSSVKCDPSSGSAIASSWPWGSKMIVYDLFWNYIETVQAATLVHEGSHMGAATTDAAYFWQIHEYPHDTFWVSWHNIASTYDSWIIEGFCIPGYNCSGIPTFPYPKRLQKECP